MVVVLSFIQGEIPRVWNIFLLRFCLLSDQLFLDRGPYMEATWHVVFTPLHLLEPACVGLALQLVPWSVDEFVEV